MRSMRPITLGLVVAVAVAAVGCWPRVVTDITESPANVKVTYVKRGIFFPETGVVECQRAEDGSLSNCKKLEVVWRKPGQ